MVNNCKLPDFINPMAMRTYPARGCRKRPSSLQQKHCRELGFNNAVMCAFPVDDMSMITSSINSQKVGLADNCGQTSQGMVSIWYFLKFFQGQVTQVHFNDKNFFVGWKERAKGLMMTMMRCDVMMMMMMMMLLFVVVVVVAAVVVVLSSSSLWPVFWGMWTWTTAGKIPPDEMQCQENCEQIQRSFLQGCPSAGKVSCLSDCSRPT